MTPKKAVSPPAAPVLPRQLDDWSGRSEPEIELNDCLVHDKDFAVAIRLEIDGCKLTNVQFAGTSLKKLQLSDTLVDRLEAAGIRAPEGSCLRVSFKDSRLTGADLGQALLEDCLFQNVKLDEAGLRFITMKRVRFENCVLRNVDFSGATLSHVSFSGCDLEGANFDNATCNTVDLRGENLSAVKGVLGLKGATISSEQLTQLAPLLATEVGLDVDYEV